MQSFLNRNKKKDNQFKWLSLLHQTFLYGDPLMSRSIQPESLPDIFYFV
jgi:hypothetical protein